MKLVYEKSYGEGSYGFVYENDGQYEVYEVPLYGGHERFEGSYETLQEAIRQANSFT